LNEFTSFLTIIVISFFTTMIYSAIVLSECISDISIIISTIIVTDACNYSLTFEEAYDRTDSQTNETTGHIQTTQTTSHIQTNEATINSQTIDSESVTHVSERKIIIKLYRGAEYCNPNRKLTNPGITICVMSLRGYYH
jgi:hypothetical protein